MDKLLVLLIKLFIFYSSFARKLSRLGIGHFEEWTPATPEAPGMPRPPKAPDTPQAPARKLKLLMVGYNGARNTGADARVVAAVKQIKELFGPDKVSMTVMTLSARSLEGYFDEDVELLEFSSIYPKDLYKACSSHHAAVLCEGSTLKSKFANALSLFFCEASGIMARQGKPCIAFGSEVGYMEEDLRKFAAKACRGTYFITRTQQSQNIIAELGLEGHKGTDTAWLYDRAEDGERIGQLLRGQGWDGEKPLLGVAVIDPFIWPVRASLRKWIKGGLTGRQEGQYDKWYYYSDSPKRRADFDWYIEGIAKAVNQLCETKGFFPVLLGMEKMDIGPCRKLEGKLNMPAAVFASGEYPAHTMTGILQTLAALITSRYHAAVLSMEHGCPIAAVSMDERLDSLMEEIEMDEEYLFHVWDEDLGEELAEAITKGCGRKETIKEHLKNKVQGYKRQQRKMGEFLKRYITDRLEGLQ